MQLEMEDDDTIEVFQQQTGGHWLEENLHCIHMHHYIIFDIHNTHLYTLLYIIQTDISTKKV